MKIIPKGSSPHIKTSSSSKKKSPMTVSSFSQMIDETTDDPILESIFDEPDYILSNISVLAEELDRLGKELADKPLPDTFSKYKKHIRLLLKGAGRNVEIQENTVSTRISKFSRATRTKFFRTAQAIDETLAELAHRILNDEKNRIDILKLTNQLQGLVLDILS